MKNLQENKHFSHHHVLMSLMLEEGEEINCNGCETLVQEPFHGCLSCNYFLHDSCINTPRFQQHPFILIPTLLPTPTYSSQSYTCNACLSEGKSFSLSCAQCEFDLHLQCASLPKTVRIHKRHPHVLKLIFEYPHKDNKTILACDVCGKMIDQTRWLHYCTNAGCENRVHVDCCIVPITASSRKGKGMAKNGGGEETQKIEDESQMRLAEEQEFDKSVYEMQRKMEEQTIAHKLVLQART